MKIFGLTRWLKITPKGVRVRKITRIPAAIRSTKIAAWNFTHPFRNLFK